MVAEHDVHRVRLELLRLRQQLTVKRELQHVSGLGAAREFGVDDFVAPGAERGRPFDSAQEVRVAEKAVVHERRLVDYGRTTAHGLQGGRGSLGKIALAFVLGGSFCEAALAVVLSGSLGRVALASRLSGSSRSGWNFDDTDVLVFQARQVFGLELVTFVDVELTGFVGLDALRPKQGVFECGAVERGRMLALVERDEVRSR